MVSFPSSIDTFKTYANLPGIIVDDTKLDILFAEDLNKICQATIAIENALGVNFINVWPIGSIYTTVGGAANTPPFSFGTWSITAVGRMEVGQDVNDVQFDTLEETGGEKTVTLSISTMPSHWHEVTSRINNDNGSNNGGAFSINQPGTTGANYYNLAISDVKRDSPSSNNTAVGALATGGSGAHNNLPPYYVVRKWKRTA